MPVHGVKGELLTRNRILIPLAAARRECWYFFPRHSSFSCAPIVLRALYRRSFSIRRVCVEPSGVGPCAGAPLPSAMPARRDVDRILSIEPSASGAGKKAAYDALGRTESDVLAVRLSEIWRSLENVRDRDAHASQSAHRAEAMRMREVVSCVKDYNGAKRNASAAPVS